MSMVFEEEEKDEMYARAEDTAGEQDREVTLNSATVLGIFFGSVLICALCFGAGYALGRRSAPRSVGDGPAAAKSAAERVEMNPSAELPEYRAKPSASSKEVTTVANSPRDGFGANDAGGGETAQSETEDKPVSAPAVKKIVNAPVAVKAAVAPTAAPAAGTYMVQIAAVSNPGDAEALRGALSKRGYSVVIRHATMDALLHVQIGPFPSRGDAAAMRQKLLGDGYNAILK